MNSCLICGHASENIFTGKMLNKYNVNYYQCPSCGFVFTEKPFWLDEAYKDSIADTDTGIMSRTINDVLIANILLELFYEKKGKGLDFGGGYGIFTRMMRDLGFEWVWYDKYSENIMVKGFEYKKKEKIEMVTAFELFEHFDNPMKELRNLFSISKNILFSTVIYDNGFDYKEFDKWWYYAPETGQHISFYSKKTLEYIASLFGVNYYMINEGVHLFTEKKLNPIKIKLIFRTRLGKLMQYYKYEMNRKYGLAASDRKMMIELQKS